MAQAYRRFGEIVGHEAPTDRPETVAEAIAAWQLIYGGKWEVWILNAWDDFAGTTELDRLGLDHLAKYTRHLRRQKQAASTIRHKVRLATRVLRWCIKNDYLATLPEAPNLPKPLVRPRDARPAELMATFASLPERARNVLRFILETGARPGEAVGLRWEDVQLPRAVCVLGKHKTARTGTARTLYLSPDAIAVLRTVPTRTGYVFRSQLGKPYTVAGLRSILQRHGLQTIYSLRHTRAQTMLDQGCDISDVAAALGHRDLSIVQIYAQVRDARARHVARSLVSPLQVPPADHSKTAASVASESKRRARPTPNPRTPTTRRGGQCA